MKMIVKVLYEGEGGETLFQIKADDYANFQKTCFRYSDLYDEGRYDASLIDYLKDIKFKHEIIKPDEISI